MNKFVEFERKKILSSKPSINTDRASLYTKGFQDNEHLPPKLRHAKALFHVLDNFPIRVERGEIIAGHMLLDYPGANIYPEGVGLRIVPELEELEDRTQDPFRVPKKAIKALRKEIEPYWKDKNIESKFNSIVRPTVRNVIDTAEYHSSHHSNRMEEDIDRFFQMILPAHRSPYVMQFEKSI